MTASPPQRLSTRLTRRRALEDFADLQVQRHLFVWRCALRLRYPSMLFCARSCDSDHSLALNNPKNATRPPAVIKNAPKFDAMQNLVSLLGAIFLLHVHSSLTRPSKPLPHSWLFVLDLKGFSSDQEITAGRQRLWLVVTKV